MKEQPLETKEHIIGHSIGQRPIHTTYEPPGPLPQFRSRPRLIPVQAQPEQVQKPAPKRLLHVAAAVKQSQKAPPEASPEQEIAARQKSR